MNKSNKKLKSNIIYSGIFQILFFLAPIITTPYVARIFLPEQLGIYATTFSLATLFLQLANFGIPIYGVRVIAQSTDNNRDSKFISLFFMQIMMTIITFIIYIGMVFLFFDNKTYYVFQGLLILVSIFDVSWFYIGIEEIKKTIFRNILSKVITILLILFFVNSRDDFILYILINITGVLIGNITMILQLPQYLSINNMSIRFSRAMFISSLGLCIPQLMETFKNTVSRSLLVFFSSYAAVGYFDQGTKIIVMINGIIFAASNALLPRLSSLVKDKKALELNKIINIFLRVNTFFSVFLISGVINVAEYFVPIFFGDGYENVVAVMIITSFSILLTSSSYFFGKGVLIAYSLDKFYRRTVFYSMITIGISNLIFAYFFAELGASFSLVISSAIQLSMSLYYLRKVVEVKKVIWSFLTALTLIFFNFIIVNYVKDSIMSSSDMTNLLVVGFLSVMFNFISILFFKLVSRKF